MAFLRCLLSELKTFVENLIDYLGQGKGDEWCLDRLCCCGTTQSRISAQNKAKIHKRIKLRTCMTSKSCTYLRSVSTISLIMLLRAASRALAGTAVLGTSLTRESIDSCGVSNCGESGGGSNISGGRRSTMVVTVLTTYQISV